MKLDTVQLTDIVLNTSDDFEIIIDFPWPTYPVLQYIVCRKNALIELTQLIGINVKIYLNSFADAAAFINWLDRFCGSIHQAGGEVIFHSKKVASIQETDPQLWSAFVKMHPMLDHDLHAMVGGLFDEGQRAHQFLYDIVLLICKLRISGFQTIRVSQVHQMVAKKHGCAVESITGYVIAPLRNAALFRDPVIQPYLYGNKSFQVCRVYGSLATRLLDGLPLILCKSNVSFYFDQEGHPMN